MKSCKALLAKSQANPDMKNWFIKLLFCAVGAVAFSAHGLTIIPTFDSSITGDANVVAMTNAITAGIRVLQSNLLDNVTVKITFVADEGIGLGQSSTFGSEYSYADFLAALKSHAASANDTNALSRLPNSSTDPVVGGTNIHLTTAQARLLGLDTYNDTDSTISFKMSLMNFTRPPADVDKYDLAQVAEHEMDEVLGISSGLPITSVVWPVDLFRYTSNHVRTFTTGGPDNAYFSLNGTNLIARYNMSPEGDYGDWWSFYFPTNWSPVTGDTLNFGQVQDAFSGSGVAIDLGTAELTALDVVGWTVAAAATPSAPPQLNIVRSGVNQYTLSWSNSFSGFVLQERTNLNSGSWVSSTSGSTNPAVVISPDSKKFYRLFKSGGASLVAAPSVAPAAQRKVPLYQVTRVYRPQGR